MSYDAFENFFCHLSLGKRTVEEEARGDGRS